MRTTIDLPDEQRGKLLELAARRGEKGFSGLVQEAVSQYLASEAQRHDKTRAALAVIGGLDEREAEELRESVHALRKRWR